MNEHCGFAYLMLPIIVQVITELDDKMTLTQDEAKDLKNKMHNTRR